MKRRLLLGRSRRFTPRTNDYTYPQLRMERVRVSHRSSRSVPAARSGTEDGSRMAVRP